MESNTFVLLLVKGDRVFFPGLKSPVGKYTFDAAKREHRFVYEIDPMLRGEFKFQISVDKITVLGEETYSNNSDSCTISWQGTLMTSS